MMNGAIKYQHLMARLLNVPLLTTERRALTLFGVLGPRAGWAADTMVIADAEQPPVMLGDLASSAPRLNGPRDDRKVYRQVDGIAVIPVEGDLVNKLGTLDPWCGMTGYDGIVYKLDEADADPDIRGAVLEINSCGGEALGCETVGAAIRRFSKPIMAICWEAYSAAYWIASQCPDGVSVTATGGVGSVGALSLHYDVTKRMENDGLAVTVLRAGLHKAEGDPYTPLADDVRDRMLADLAELRVLFAAEVATGRGLSLEEVLDTEAATFGASQSVELGLADAVMTPDDALAQFITDLDSQVGLTAAPAAHQQPEGQQTMAPKKTGNAGRTSHQRGRLNDNAPPAAEDDVQADEDAEEEDDQDQDGDGEGQDDDNDGDGGEDKAEDDGGDDEAKARTKARASESNRIFSILNSKEGKANAALANHLAQNTRMSAKDAIAALVASGPGAQTNGRFAQAMANNAGPKLGAGGRGDDHRSTLATAVARQVDMLKSAKGGR